MFNNYNQGSNFNSNQSSNINVAELVSQLMNNYLNGQNDPSDHMLNAKKQIIINCLNNQNDFFALVNNITTVLNQNRIFNINDATNVVINLIGDYVNSVIGNSSQQVGYYNPQPVNYNNYNRSQFPQSGINNQFRNFQSNNQFNGNLRNQSTNLTSNGFRNNQQNANQTVVNPQFNFQSSNSFQKSNTEPIEDKNNFVKKEIIPLLFEGDVVIKQEQRPDGSNKFETDTSKRKYKMNLDQLDFQNFIKDLEENNIALDDVNTDPLINAALISSGKNILLSRHFKHEIIYSDEDKNIEKILQKIHKSKDYDDLLIKLDELYKDPEVDKKILKLIDNRINRNLEKVIHQQIDYDLEYGAKPISFCILNKSIIEIMPALRSNFCKSLNEEGKKYYSKELEKTFNRVKILTLDSLTESELENKYKSLKENHKLIMENFKLNEKNEYKNPLILTNKIILISCKYTNAELNIKFNTKEQDEKLIVPDNMECSIKKLIRFFEDQDIPNYESYIFMLKTLDNKRYEISTDLNFNKIWLSREYIFKF